MAEISTRDARLSNLERACLSVFETRPPFSGFYAMCLSPDRPPLTNEA